MTTRTDRAAGSPADGSGKVTRDAVLAAALEIIDRDGADALSMRRLARALDRDPMILYRHAPGKAALLDGVAETVLAQLDVDSADPDWAGQLREVARRFRALALAHPHVVPLIVTRPLATPLGLRPLGTLRPLEDILALLTRAGFSGPDALHIYRALFGFLHGHVLDELQELTVSPEETDDLLRLGLHRLPIGDFPLLRGLAPVLAAYDGAAELERGLDILLTGLTTTLTPTLRGRPRGRLRGTIVPLISNSPPQTPQGSPRSSAPARQASLARHPRHIALACSAPWAAGVSATPAAWPDPGMSALAGSVANMTGGGHDGCHDDPGRLVRPGPGTDGRGHGGHARRRVPLRAG